MRGGASLPAKKTIAPAPGSFTFSRTEVIERGEVVSPTVIMGFGMPKAGRVPEVRKLSTVAFSVRFALSDAIGDVDFD